MWWDYIDLFNVKCNDKDPTFNTKCSEAQMKSAGYTPNDVQAVRQCAGYGTQKSIYDYVDPKTKKTRNLVLDAEIKQQRDDNIFTIPTIIINNEPYRGGYTCPHPPQLATCGVLSAVCSAFIDGKEPPACKTDYCWDMMDDCGTCLKANVFLKQKNLLCCDKSPGKSYDSCGHCLNITDPNFNKCYQAGQKAMTTGVVGGVVAVFIILLLVIGAVVAVAIILLKRKDQETRRYVDSVVSSYLPMDDKHDDEDEQASLTGNAESTATL